MKKIISFLMSVFLIFSLSACGNGNGNQPSEERNTEEMMTESQDASVQTKQDGTENTNSRILIAYFSVPEDVDTDGVDAVSGASIVVKDNEVMGNTEYVAKTIQKTIGGDLFRIETVDKYPLDHETLVNQAADEQDDSARPELAAHIENLERYDTIILGYPLWWYDLPQVMYSFFDEYDFSGKTIIPFDVHRGSRLSSTPDTIQELEPDATVISDGFAVVHETAAESISDVAADVEEWLHGLGY